MENLFIAQAYTSEGVVENGCPSFVMPLTIKRLARRHLWHMTRNLVNNLKVPKLWVADRREPGRSNINHCQTLGKELLFWNDEYSSRWCKLVQTCSWLCDNKWNTMELCGAWFDSELCYCFSVLLRSVYILPKRLPFVKAICTQGRRVVLDSWGPKVSDILGGSRSWQHLEHFGFSIFGTFWRSKPCSNLHALIHWRWPWVPTFCIATGLKQAVQIVSFFWPCVPYLSYYIVVFDMFPQEPMAAWGEQMQVAKPNHHPWVQKLFHQCSVVTGWNWTPWKPANISIA
jgi:hypothetical protein